MRIGIITFHRALNCGAALQAWALRTLLVRNGYEVGFIANKVGEPRRWFPLQKRSTAFERIKAIIRFAAENVGSLCCRELSIRRFGDFRRKFMPEIPVEECDVLIVGSDQIWRHDLTGAETSLFLGESTPHGIPIIAYAASFGEPAFAAINAKDVVEAIQRYHAVSVREQFAKDCLPKSLADEITVVADPTALLLPDDYAAISAKVCVRKPYLFAYAVHATPFFVQTARAAARRLGLDLVMTAACQQTRWRAPMGMTYGVSPDIMVGYIRGAQCVVASSFHGTVISFVLRKPFVSLQEDWQGALSRQSEFLARIGETSRIATHQTPTDIINSALRSPPVADAWSKFSEFRGFSCVWIENALKTLA